MEKNIEVTTTSTSKKESGFLVLLFRIIVGLVFMFSGAVKAIDPLGSCYKFTDYFTLAFDMPQLSVTSLPLAFILAALEFSVGFMLFFNMKGRLGAWLSLAFMVVFTPLTLFIALKNPVHDCGCFGDALLLTNWATFAKNIILIAMVIYLVIKRKKIDNPLDDRAELGIAIAVFCIALVFQHIMIRHLPIIDFRPYKIGVNIAKELDDAANAPQPNTRILLVYANTVTGEVREFDQDEAPYSDTTWVWKDTKTEIVYDNIFDKLKAWTLEPPEKIHDFTICDSTGQDYTQQMLNAEKPVLLVITYKLENADIDGLNMLSKIKEYADEKGYITVGMTASNWDLIYRVRNEFNLNFPFFVTDEITLKTMVRANPGIMKLEKGTIVGKWNFRDFKLNKNL